MTATDTLTGEVCADLLTVLGARSARVDGSVARGYFTGLTADGRDAHVVIGGPWPLPPVEETPDGRRVLRFARHGTYTGTVTVPIPAGVTDEQLEALR